VCNLKDTTLRVIGDEDLAIAVGVIFVLGSDITIGSENYKAPVCSDVTHEGVETKRA
jgi:hypothetical protein